MAHLSWRLLAPLVAVAGLAALLPRWASSEPIQASTERQPSVPVASPPAAPSPALAARRDARRVVAVPWGTQAGALGHEVPAEGAPQGPMSFAVDASGKIHALDTVNGRITILDPGRPARSVPLPSVTIDDLDLTEDGGYVVVDRHVGKVVHFLSAQGKERGRVELVGEGVPQPGLVTALFARGDGVWVEVEHRRLVRVADRHGAAAERRAVVPGRFTADGKGLLAAARQGATARVTALSPSLQARTLGEVSFPLPVAVLTALEGQQDGGVIVGAVLHRDEDTAPFRTAEVRHLVVGLGPDGAERWRSELPVDEGPEENLRPVRLGLDGALYGMVFRKEGVEFWKVTP